MGIEREIDSPRMIVTIQDFLPRLSAVLGPEDATLFIRTIRMAERNDIDEVRVFRVDTNFRDGLCVSKAHVVPGLARISGLINPIPLHDVAAQLCLAGADVHDVRVRFRDCYCTY